MTGYQDYVRESKTAGTLLAQGTVHGNAQVNIPAFYCGDYEYLIITLDMGSSTHYWEILPAFYSDATLANLMGFTTGGLGTGFVDSVVARVRGPWASAYFGYWDVSNTDTADYYVYGCNFAPMSTPGPSPFGPWGYYNASIPATTTETINLPWHSGTAFMSFMGSVANYPIITIQQYQFQLGWQTYLNMDSNPTPNNAYTNEVPIGPVPTRIHLVNPGAAAVTAYFMIMPRSFSPI
jgi:hypothetical protein